MKPVQKKPDPKIRPQRLVARSNPQHDETLTHSPVPSKQISSISQISCVLAATFCQFGASILMDLGGDLTRCAFLMAHWRESMMHKGGVA